MTLLPTARLVPAILACLALIPTIAVAAGGALQIPPMTSIHLGPPQWTLNVPISVNHMTSQFVAVGAVCDVTGKNGGDDLVGQGEAVDQPISGGAFSGTESVPVYLGSGRLATQAQNYACVIIFKDSAGKLYNPYHSGDPAAQPNPSMPSNLWVGGSL